MGWSRQADVVQPVAETESEGEEQRRQMIDFMLDGFDVESDEIDRRIYQEMVMTEGGLDSMTSDDEDEVFDNGIYRYGSLFKAR